MLISLTVQSENRTPIALRDSLRRITGTIKKVLFESADMLLPQVNTDATLVGNTSFEYNRKTYGVLESITDIQMLVNLGVSKYSESDSNIELFEGVLKSISFVNSIGETSADFSLNVSCRDAEGNIDYLVENITKDGFDITATSNCSLSYIAIKH